MATIMCTPLRTKRNPEVWATWLSLSPPRGYPSPSALAVSLPASQHFPVLPYMQHMLLVWEGGTAPSWRALILTTFPKKAVLSLSGEPWSLCPSVGLAGLPFLIR